LYEISDPDHGRYGQHLSKEQVDSLVAPHPESVSLVDEWLESHGISLHSMDRSHSKDSIVLKIPVAKAEEMLKTVF
jgi:tripeptidyl-peptidase-1